MNAESAGSTDVQIMGSHVLPNVSAPIIVQATLVFAFSILNEATLSFLGVGTQPPKPSWGLMLREGKQYLAEAPWIALFTGLAIMITVLSLNFLGDALRDVLDPRHTEERVR
jgi:peptide/nickel transport system permease protein